MNQINIFILAAGLGERLRPITTHIPKPLVPIIGKPILQIILEKVSTLPVNKIGINLYQKKGVIEGWIKQSAFKEKVKLFPEEPILGTGGALKNAEPFLSGSTFLVHNSDILSNIDLEKLIEFHLSSENLVTLTVHDYPEFNNLIIDENGYLIDLRHKILKSETLNLFQGKVQNDTYASRLLSYRTRFGISKLKAFTGIAVYHPEFLKFLPARISSIVDAWLNAVAAGYKIGTLDVSSCYWKDIGTPSAYASAVIDALRADGETVYIHPSINRCRDINMKGYVVVEKNNRLPKNVSLRNCVILPESKIDQMAQGAAPSIYENCILGPDFKIDLNESEMLGSSNDKILIGTGGSERKYYRINKNGKTIVLMKCRNNDADYQRHIEYTNFFSNHKIPVPQLIESEPDKMTATFEDLGDLSLYSWLKCRRENVEIEKIYRKVLDILILIHTEATVNVSECPMLQNRIFDYEHFRWETGYFIERFVEDIKGIKVKNLTALQDEFHRLAIKANSFSKTVIHRDFQSQNIMIHKGILRVIDYQGARMGPPAYDVASILWDPYYRLESNTRERLLGYYISKMGERLGEKFSERDFRETLLPCRLQRHMQALGAYGFLSTIKGKKYFLKHVPEGVRVLNEDISILRDEYPELYALVRGLYI
ncbi:MAG: sugar phosphate nucleotidyltransferase [Nitrospirota bacterium]